MPLDTQAIEIQAIEIRQYAVTQAMALAKYASVFNVTAMLADAAQIERYINEGRLNEAGPL